MQTNKKLTGGVFKVIPQILTEMLLRPQYARDTQKDPVKCFQSLGALTVGSERNLRGW